MAKKRPNVIPIIEDARHPARYRMLVPMVDAIFADVAQPDQVRCSQCLYHANPSTGADAFEAPQKTVARFDCRPAVLLVSSAVLLPAMSLAVLTAWPISHAFYR